MFLATILGNLGRDAEVKTINDKQYLSFSVASTEKRNNEETTTWVSVLHPYQESLLPYLKKGQQVFVQGRLKAGIYQSQNTFGIDLSVFANTLQLCGGKREDPTAPAASSPSAPAASSPSTSAAFSQQQPQPAQPPFPPMQNGDTPAYDEQKDDLPFYSMTYKKKEPITHRCGDCANVTPVLAPRHLLNIHGEPTLGTCPHWTESRCTLLSWKSQCPHFKPKLT